MATFRIHRLKPHLQQNFRSAPHVGGVANVKPRDYEPGPALPSAEPMLAAAIPGELVDAASPYGAYFALRDGLYKESAPLNPGDLLESESGALRIYKYVGFEEAQWVYPEPRANAAHAASENVAETAVPV
jgi:hypothetical protein